MVHPQSQCNHPRPKAAHPPCLLLIDLKVWGYFDPPVQDIVSQYKTSGQSPNGLDVMEGIDGMQ